MTRQKKASVSPLSTEANLQNKTPTDYSTSNKQRRAILDYLLTGNHLTTIFARQVLGVMHPAARLQELREDGWNIVTHYTTETDVAGKKHRQGAYVLFTVDVA